MQSSKQLLNVLYISTDVQADHCLFCLQLTRLANIGLLRALVARCLGTETLVILR